jgi:hypothetical protein
MIEAPQDGLTDYEAVYISENFGVPFTTAVQITQLAAQKTQKAKNNKKNRK